MNGFGSFYGFSERFFFLCANNNIFAKILTYNKRHKVRISLNLKTVSFRNEFELCQWVFYLLYSSYTIFYFRRIPFRVQSAIHWNLEHIIIYIFTGIDTNFGGIFSVFTFHCISFDHKTNIILNNHKNYVERLQCCLRESESYFLLPFSYVFVSFLLFFFFIVSLNNLFTWNTVVFYIENKCIHIHMHFANIYDELLWLS